MSEPRFITAAEVKQGEAWTNIARVDPYGDDAIGQVGFSDKPFRTLQAAVDALVVSGGDNPVLDIGANRFSDGFITNIALITITGSGSWLNGSGNGAAILGDITFTATVATGSFQQVTLGNVIHTGTSLDVTLSEVYASTISGNQVSVISGRDNAAVLDIIGTGSIFAWGGFFSVVGHDKACNVTLVNCYAGDVSADALTVQDARGLVDLSGWEYNTIAFADGYLNPANFDFSTLPQATSDSGLRIGQAWIDTTGGLNIVKVKLA